MKVAVFSTKSYDREHLEAANQAHGHALTFFDARLEVRTAVLARGFEAVCAFVNDRLPREVLELLANNGIRLVALRCAGFNHVDTAAANDLGITIARVPAYSPYAVAEHAVGLILTLNRKIHRAYSRVRDGNFSLEGLCGFDLHGRRVGIVGMGKIGQSFAQIMQGFGCKLLAFDPKCDVNAIGVDVSFVTLAELFAASDIISLHCPLTPDTHHLIDGDAIQQMRRGVMIINTGRGALVDTPALIAGLKTGQIGFLGLDVYEEEEELFFQDLSARVIQDDVFMRLVTFPNVVITAHQGFFTEEALRSIADTTLENISAFSTGNGILHAIDI